MQVKLTTIEKGDIMRVEICFINGDHHLKIGDAMRVEIGLFNGDHHLEKGDIMRVGIVFEW